MNRKGPRAGQGGNKPITGRQPPAGYQIRVRGHLGATMRRAFPALHAESQDGDTLLQGAVADQAALHGVLAQVEALGLELLEVRRLPASGSRARGLIAACCPARIDPERACRQDRRKGNQGSHRHE